MRVLIDTNVLVSAILRDRDPEAVILFIIDHPDFEWVVSLEILAEYKQVLARDKFGIQQELLQQWYELLDTYTTTVDGSTVASHEIRFPRDQKNAKFLTCALLADADFFVTGDRDFSEATKLVNTTILSVSLFKKLVIDALD